MSTTATQKPTTKAQTQANAIAKTVEGFKDKDMVTQGEIVNILKTEFGFKLKDVATVVDVSAPSISNLHLLVNLPKDIQRMIRADEISGTLVLDIYRDFKDMGEGKIATMIREVIAAKKRSRKVIAKAGGEVEVLKITKKDFNRFTDTYNSATIFQKFARNNRGKIPKDKMVLFEAMNGLVEGRLNEASFQRLFFK